MLCLRSGPSFFLFSLSVFLYISLAFGSSRVHHTLRSREVFIEKEYTGAVQWSTRRSVAEVGAGNSSLILAETRTHRKDPLDGFKRYTGGWNISNGHYWASVGLTAAPFFVVAVVWFVLFGLTLFIICLRHCCCRRERFGYSRVAYALSLIFLILFTLSAIAGCIVLYIGQGKFHSSTTYTLEYVVNQADTVSENLKNVSGYLDAAKGITVDSIFLPSDAKKNIDDIRTKINSSASTLSQKTSDNSKDIQDLLDSVRRDLIIIAAVMLFLAFIGFVFSIFGMQPLVYFLVIIGWILVTGTFILCGVFLLLHNVAADTCVAMDEWVQNPTAHTALDDILPCLNNATEAWKKYICQVSASGSCTTPGRVTPTYYNQMAASVNVSYGLYRYAPFLVGLQDCTFVRETFTAIGNDHCPGLRRHSEWIYVGLVMVSAAVMLSLVFWVIYARERRHRVYTKRHMPRSLDVEDKAT
ncbi:hypothetical protein I3843_15G159500 [Carya illinoinensis]|nr:hypothetical protein I3843_15G159500 [Carya illinoinensis]